MKKPDAAALRAALENARTNAHMMIGVIAAVFLLDAAVLVRGQLMPTARAFSKARQLKKEIHQAQSDAVSVGAYRKNLEDLKVSIISLEKKMTTESDLPAVLEAISNFADISAVRILRIKPLAVLAPTGAEEGAVSRQRIEVVFKGGFHQMGRFVALLENAPTFMNIQKLEIYADTSEYMKQAATIVLEVVLKKV